MTTATEPRRPAEPEPAIVNSTLERIAEATDFLEFEQAWIDGLRQVSASDGSVCRALLLAEAGRRLTVFDDIEHDIARRHWLDQVVAEVPLCDDAALDAELAVVAKDQLREAFAHAGAAIRDLRTAVDSEETLLHFATRCPHAADHIRDLGRIAEGLRGSGLLALCSAEDYELARSLELAMKPPIHLVPAVPESLRVAREDLLRWARGHGAAAAFPKLVRRLIAETEPSIGLLHMPAGTGVSSPDWDGVVKCSRGNRFVPAGTSVWELTTQQDGTHSKAVEDYTKRAKDTTPDQGFEITYVAVACASWNKAQKFASQHSDEGDFSMVSALNVDDLEEWLSCAIATTVWMREQIGEPTVGIRLLARWWENWLAATTTPLDERFVLAGREQIATDLRDRHNQGPGVVTVGGQIHRDEIIAFLAAALVTEDAEGMGVGDVLFVDDHDAAQRLFAQEAMSMPSSRQSTCPVLTIVVPSADYAQHLPAGSPHRMIVPIPGSIQTEIVLDPVDSAEVSKHFEDTGVEHHEAHRLAGLARMSLLALRRHLSAQPDLHMPDWSKGTPDRTIRRSLLLGGWNATREGDCEIVERFTGRSHEDVAEELRKIDRGDSPMTSTCELWHAVSPTDTWILLRAQLSPSDLQEFVEIAVEVLTTSDPLREKSHEEALRAQINCTKAKYSSQLRQGIATTLALAGTNPPTPHGQMTPDSHFAEDATQRVLRSAMDDATPSTWIAVTGTLPLLAEAAPDAVLESLRTCVAEQHAFTQVMFTDHADHSFGFSASSPHLRILNALEVIAWSPDHLLSAADVLARLASIDPGGRYTNRPDATLASIFCSWLPYTSADSEVRLKAVGMLRKAHPSVAWPLMLSMLPRHHNVQTPGALPQFRDWRPPNRPVVPPEERARLVCEVSEMLLEDVKGDPDRWVQLIEHMDDLPEDARRSAISQMDKLADSGANEQFKSTLWPVLRDFLSRHREFSDALWVLPEAEMQALEQVLTRLRPSAPEVAFGHLFSSGLPYIDGINPADDYEEFQTELRSRQTEVVETILSDGSLESVLDFAAAVEVPHQVGAALAICEPALDADLLQAMEASPVTVTDAARGYFGQRFASLGWDGLTEFLSDNHISAQVAADVLRSLPPVEMPWTRVDAFGTYVAMEYWNRVGYHDLGVLKELSDLLKVCRRLRTAGRVGLVVRLLARCPRTHTSEPEFVEEAAAALEQWLDDPSNGTEHSVWTPQGLVRLFGVLNERRDHLGVTRMAVLEWRFLPLLDGVSRFSTPNLHREMASDGDLFVRLVELAFGPANAAYEEQPHPTDAQRQTALSADRVLKRWPPAHFCPALNGNGDLDPISLDEWVDSTRERLAAVDRADIGDQMIGAALASSPPDSNGDWPGEAVRNLLERLQSGQVEHGFCITLLNQRSVTTRSPTDGGDQERQLTQRYKEQSRQYAQWPRTAAIFSRLAKRYEREGSVLDRQAEVTRRGLGR